MFLIQVSPTQSFILTMMRREPLYVETKAYPLTKDESGKVMTVIEILVDITEKKKAEEALQETSRLNRQIIESAQEGIIVYGLDLKYQIWNFFMERLTGLPADKVLGRHPLEVFPFLLEAGIVAGIEKALTGEVSEAERFQFHVPNTGRSGWASEISAPLKNAKGEIIGVIATVRDITEHVRAEESMQASAREWTEAFDAINDMITIHDADFNIVRANKAAESGLGLAMSDILTNKCFKSYHGRDCPPEGCPSCTSLKTGLPSTTELFEPHLNRFVEIKAMPRFDAHHNIIGVVHVVRDITERKQLNKVMRENEEKFRNLFNNAEVGMFRSRLDGSEVLDVNQKFLDIVGKTREETLGKPSRILWADPKERQKMVQRLVAEGRVSQLEFQMLNEEEGVRDCITSLLLYREQGILEGSILDITERKNIEKALQESEERFRSAFEHAAIGFSIYSTKGHFIRVNQALCDMLGYSEEELKSRTFQDITHPDDLESNMDQINQLLSGKLPVGHFRTRYIHKLGHEVWTSLSVSVVRDDRGVPMYLISLIEDLTEKRKLEDQLRHAQKMEAVGTLAGGIAHDFNNILNVIIGYGTMVQDSLEADQSFKRADE